MRIYRVEHKDTKLGPWRHTEVQGIHYESSNSSNLPAMHGSWAIEAGMSKAPREQLRLGVRRLGQLFDWFSTDDLQKLHNDGFVLRMYAVRSLVMKDKHQVLAHLPDKKRPVVTISLTEVAAV